MTPECFSGGWRRVSIALDGGPHRELAAAVWLQVGDTFADLRIPGGSTGSAASFAGTTTWEAPHLRWNHHLDLGADPDDDVGLLRWDGEDLIESGSFAAPGDPVTYVEVWRRLDAATGPLLSLTRRDGLATLLRCGRHSLTIADDRPHGGAYRACYRIEDGDGWVPELSLGPGARDLPEPPDDDLPAGIAIHLDAHRWHVVEARRSPART